MSVPQVSTGSTAGAAVSTVAIRVDALARLGVGHLIRQLALAEEFQNRGRRVRLFGATDVLWVAGQLAARGLELEPAGDDPAAFARLLVREGVGLCVLDGYEFSGKWGAALRASEIVVGALCDGEFGLGQEADLYVDQNLGAVARPDVHPGATWLVGLDYVLLRDVVRDRRPLVEPEQKLVELVETTALVEPVETTPDEHVVSTSSTNCASATDSVPRVLVVFGGTDPYGGCEVYVPLLLATGRPVHVIAIAARPEVGERLRSLPLSSGQSVEVLPPVDDLPGMAVTCGAAVSAAGTSVWELACLGVPTALVCVTDNQLLGYREASKELCLAAGELKAVKAGDTASALTTLDRLVSDADLRAALARRGMAAVDGRGRERVADALEALAGHPLSPR